MTRKKPRMQGSQAGLARAARRIGHQFSDTGLLQCALTHASISSRRSRHRQENYERLEFVGDHVLGLCVADILYRTYSGAGEGELSRHLSGLVQRATCAHVAETLGLGEFVRHGLRNEQFSGRARMAILADICEAVVAAIYFDAGFERARDFVARLWLPLIKTGLHADVDAKSRLQLWAQKKALALPHYRLEQRDGPDHSPCFTVSVSVPDAVAARGVGASLREAEQSAASAALDMLHGPGHMPACIGPANAGPDVLAQLRDG